MKNNPFFSQVKFLAIMCYKVSALALLKGDTVDVQHKYIVDCQIATFSQTTVHFAIIFLSCYCDENTDAL